MVAELGFLNRSAVIESSFSSSSTMAETGAGGSPERRAWSTTEGPRAAQRKRTQMETGVGPAVSATGGATAPTTVAVATSIGTPPAQRRRMKEFTLRPGEPPAQIVELADLVKDEFKRVWDAIRTMEDKVDFELVDTDGMDTLQKSIDQRFAKDHADVVDLAGNMNTMEASRANLEQRLGLFEGEIRKWTATADAATAKLGEMQVLANQVQADGATQSLRSDEFIKSVVENHLSLIRKELSDIDARVNQQKLVADMATVAQTAPPAAPGMGCGQWGVNPFSTGAGLAVPSGHPGGPNGQPPVMNPPGMGMTFPNGLCHCVHVAELQTAATQLTARVTTVEANNLRIANELGPLHALPARLKALEEMREKFLKGGVYNPQAGQGMDGSGPGGDPRGGFTNANFGAAGGGTVRWSTKLFDDRTALSELYQFNGDSGGDQWRTRVRGYFIGCCPELADWLDWAEGAPGKMPTRSDEDPLTMEVTRARGSGMGEEDGIILSGLVWKFLQICCTKHASTTFNAVKPELNGLEVWRALVWEINQGRSSRMLTLRNEVHKPTPVKDYKDVSNSISRYDIVIQDFIAAGGTRPSDSELKQSFLASLPSALREALLLKATEPGLYEAFKHHIRTKVAFILHCRGDTGAHSLEHGGYEQNAGQLQQDDAELLQLSQLTPELREEILAVVKRSKGGTGNFQRRAGGEAATEQQRPPKCANCGEAHATSNCRKPRLEASKRLCFNCGEAGHMSRNCKKPKSVKLLENNSPVHVMCLTCGPETDSEGFTRVGKPKIPRPAGTSMGEIIARAFDMKKQENKYAALRDEANEDETNESLLIDDKDLKKNMSPIVHSFKSVDIPNSVTPPIAQSRRRRKARRVQSECSVTYRQDKGIEQLVTEGHEIIEIAPEEPSTREYVANTSSVVDSNDFFELIDDPDDASKNSLELHKILEFEKKMQKDWEAYMQWEILKSSIPGIIMREPGLSFGGFRDKCIREAYDHGHVHDQNSATVESAKKVTPGFGEFLRVDDDDEEDPEANLSPYEKLYGYPEEDEQPARDVTEWIDAWIDPSGSGARSCAPADETVTSNPLQKNSDNLTQAIEARLLEVIAGVDELNTITAPRMIKVAVDSGAGDHVASLALVGKRRVRPSDGSRNGRHFVSASGGTMPNQGEAKLVMKEPLAGSTVSSTFQVADVTRALYSVSKLCDSGCEVHFTAVEGVVTKDGVAIARFPRENGLYVTEMTIAGDEPDDQEALFGRQGIEE